MQRCNKKGYPIQKSAIFGFKGVLFVNKENQAVFSRILRQKTITPFFQEYFYIFLSKKICTVRMNDLYKLD